MKKLLMPLLCVVGLAACFALLPLFDGSQPRGLSITRSAAREIADRTARELGIEVDEAWPVMAWRSEPTLEEQFAAERGLRKRAQSDPVVGPRLGFFHVLYYRRGQQKTPPYGWVMVGRDGRVSGALRTPRMEEPASPASADDLRRRADAFIASGELPGAPNPVFESDRPRVLLKRTDHTFRYRVPSNFPSGDIVYLVGVHYVGSQFAGWSLIEEHRDGSELEFNESFVGNTIAQITLLFALLLVLLIIFLKKYHEGEVGVRVAGLLLATLLVLALLSGLCTLREQSIGTQFGAMDAPRTAIAMLAFGFLFLHIPVAVLVFLSWSVGESYTRERWGDRLASFDAILRRDPINATVGRSLLAGALGAPLAAAGSLAISAVPVLLGLANPSFSYFPLSIAFSGSPWIAITSAASDAIIIPVVSLLFILGSLRRKVTQPVSIVIAVALGSIASTAAPLDSQLYSALFGFGLVAIAVSVFVVWDLLAAATTIFGGTLILQLLPFIRVVEGDVRIAPLLALLLPLGVILVIAAAGMMTRREIVYHYSDLAPHVRRIVERERIRAEIDAANRIQAALLPASDPEIAGITISSHYRAATEIGGDYYDFLNLRDGRIGVAFGDVAGHGLTSGIVMAMAKAALLVQVEHDSTPTRVMEVLNGNVMKTAPPRMMMTFFFGVLEPESQTMHFSSAGHLDPYVYRAVTGELECLSSWGFPLGVKRREPFRALTVKFAPGDRLILYSDGLIEALNDAGEPFGFDRFEHTLASVATRPAVEIKQAVLQSVKAFSNNRPPEDDQTLVVLSFDEPAWARKLA